MAISLSGMPLQAISGQPYSGTFSCTNAGLLDAVGGTLMPAIKNAELKDLVKKVAPAFEAHMIAAQTLDQKLSSGKKGK